MRNNKRRKNDTVTAAVLRCDESACLCCLRGRLSGQRIMVMLTACGGGIGALAVMVLFKHKTKDKVFRITVPIAAAVHMAVLIYLILWELGVVS